MPLSVRAIRGATTIDDDTPESITERVVALLSRIMERNGLVEEDIISILFTATEDVVSAFPAAAARSMGLGAVPLILSLIHISEPTRRTPISYAVFCLK